MRESRIINPLTAKAKSIVEEIKERAELMRVKAEGLVKEGEPHEVITSAAKESEAGIIVMGSHGRTGLKRLLMGSVAERVLGYAPCPVLIVRSGFASSSPRIKEYSVSSLHG
ncbi:MAG: universal stress protein [Nitrospirota bacterium]